MQLVCSYLTPKELLKLQGVNRRFYSELVPLSITTIMWHRGNQRAEIAHLMASEPKMHNKESPQIVQAIFKRVGPFTIEMFEKVAKTYGYPLPSFEPRLTEIKEVNYKERSMQGQFSRAKQTIEGICRSTYEVDYLDQGRIQVSKEFYWFFHESRKVAIQRTIYGSSFIIFSILDQGQILAEAWNDHDDNILVLEEGNSEKVKKLAPELNIAIPDAYPN